MKIIFTGTSDFADKYLKFLIESKIDIACVITQPDKPQGRKLKLTPSPVAKTAEEHNLKLYKPLNISDPSFAQEILKPINPDVMIVVAYGQILKENILNLPKYGCINIHPSKLPLYRGAAPIQRTLLNGETNTATCIIQMDKGLDSGDIIKQQELDINPNDTLGSLETKLINIGSNLLLQTIDDIRTNNLTSTPQNHEKATYAHKIKKQDTIIDLNADADDIHNKVRALNPHPLATIETLLKNQTIRIKIWETEVCLDNSDTIPGTILKQDKDNLIIKTGKNAISIKSLQIPGKKQVKTADFLRGYSLTPDAFKNSL